MEGDKINKITARKLSFSNGKIFLVGQVNGKKWTILGAHHWEKNYWVDDEERRYNWILCGNYPESVMALGGARYKPTTKKINY